MAARVPPGLTALVLTSLGLAALGLIASGCSADPAPRQAERQAPSVEFSVPSPTERVPVEVGDIARQVVLDGRIAPRDATPVASPISGSVASLDVRQGDEVAVGDLVATIELDADATQAILEYELAAARLELATLRDEPTAELAAALDGATSKLIELDLDPERFDELGLVQVGNDQPTGGESATVAVVAERSGVVVSTNTRFGTTIAAGETVVVLGDPADLVARGTASASQRELIQRTAAADVVPRDEALTPASGTVGSIDAAGGTDGEAGGEAGGATGRASITIDLDTPDALELGTRVSIVVRLETVTDVVWVPPAAVRGSDGARFVLVDRDGDQVRVDVELGLRTDARAEILEPTDLTVGDLLVLP